MIARRRIGIVPAPGSGLRTMAANGQMTRLTRHFQAYRDAGHTLTYFTSLPNDPTDWIADVRRPVVAHSLKRAILRPLYDWSFARCDVLRATSLIGTLPAVVAKLTHGVPFVVSAGADYAAIAKLHGRPTARWSWIWRLAARFASAIIVPNASHAAAHATAYPKAGIVQIPNWVDTELFQPRPIKVTYPTILYVGRLVLEKNLIRLARVCREIDADLLCVGTGPLRDQLVSMGAKCPGVVEWADLPRWHQGAHVFCLPSYTEGHPKALLEAMASGLPCVTSDAVEGIDAARLVFPPDDDAALRKTLLRLLGDEKLRTALGESGRAAMLSHDVRVVMPREIAVVTGAAR